MTMEMMVMVMLLLMMMMERVVMVQKSAIMMKQTKPAMMAALLMAALLMMLMTSMLMMLMLMMLMLMLMLMLMMLMLLPLMLMLMMLMLMLKLKLHRLLHSCQAHCRQAAAGMLTCLGPLLLNSQRCPGPAARQPTSPAPERRLSQEGDLDSGQMEAARAKACKTAMMQTSVIDGFIVVETKVGWPWLELLWCWVLVAMMRARWVGQVAAAAANSLRVLRLGSPPGVVSQRPAAWQHEQ
jgi:hypothetical protein